MRSLQISCPDLVGRSDPSLPKVHWIVFIRYYLDDEARRIVECCEYRRGPIVEMRG